MKRLEECGAYERQFADVGGKGPRRLFDEIWRENDFDWQWEIDKGSEAFADSGMPVSYTHLTLPTNSYV